MFSLRPVLSKFRVVLGPSFAVMAGGLAGCGTITTAPPPPSPSTLCVAAPAAPPVAPPSSGPYTGASFSANVLANGKAIAGATVSLYAAGSSGNGSAATSLITGGISSDASGALTIPGGYSCPESSSLLYLVSRGGTVAGGAAANASAALMTTVGECKSVSAANHFTLNETTTVASVVALAQFYTPGNGVGASASNLAGLANAFATAAELVDPHTGLTSVPSMPGIFIAPAARVNSLANAVNACVVDAAACSSFFTAVSAGGTTPTNTLDAVYDVARSPASNVAGVFASTQASSAYLPALTKAPGDWTMFVTYEGGGLSSPSGVALDSTGSAWVSNYFYVASKFSPTGSPVFPSGIRGDGLNNSYGLAIDLNDNAWIPNEQPRTGQGIGSVSVITPTGASLAGPSGYTAGGLNYPLSIAIDPNGTSWVVDYGNSHVTLLNASGSPLSGASGYTTPDFAFPVVVAVDANHFGWLGNLSDTTVTKVAPDGSSFTNYDCCQGASGIALDQANNVWIANFYGASVSAISCKGDVVSKLGYTGTGSTDHPQGIAVDGAGNVWVANYRAPYLTELSGASSATPGSSLTPAAGLGGDAKLLEAYALALDASGNIWVSNQGSNTITKFIGLAVPVKTPLSALPQLP